MSIIDDNNIWIVGEIKFQGKTYNAVKWNGTDWELKTILYNYQGSHYYSQILSVFSFKKDDLWVGMNQPMHWNGSNWNTFDLSTNEWDGWINKIWGTSSANLYLVGDNGNITHYNGSSWQRLESGTDIDLLDVWGSPDGSVVWACGYTDLKGTILLKIIDNSVKTVYQDLEHWFSLREDTLSGVLTSLWTDNSDSVFAVTPHGVYSVPADSKGEAKRNWYNNQNVPGFPRALRGQGHNDLFIAGDFHMIAHYNGLQWRYFEELKGRAKWLGLDIKSNMVAVAGWDFLTSRAVISVGKR